MKKGTDWKPNHKSIEFLFKFSHSSKVWIMWLGLNQGDLSHTVCYGQVTTSSEIFTKHYCVSFMKLTFWFLILCLDIQSKLSVKPHNERRVYLCCEILLLLLLLILILVIIIISHLKNWKYSDQKTTVKTRF